MKPTERQLITRPIETIRPGDAVLAENPERTDSLADTDIDPQTWRLVSLSMTKENGGRLEIELLRPVDWLLDESLLLIQRTENLADLQPRPIIAPAEEVALHDLMLGRQILLDLPELGAQGPATVTAIDECPPLDEPQPGQRLVTGTFHHAAANVVDVLIDGDAGPIGVTDNHPFWSAGRRAFVPAGELALGEHLRRADGTLVQVTRITPRRGGLQL